MEEPQEITITRMGLIQMMGPRLASKKDYAGKNYKGCRIILRSRIRILSS